MPNIYIYILTVNALISFYCMYKCCGTAGRFSILSEMMGQSAVTIPIKFSDVFQRN